MNKDHPGRWPVKSIKVFASDLEEELWVSTNVRDVKNAAEYILELEVMVSLQRDELKELRAKYKTKEEG